MKIHPQIISKEGEPEFVVLPYHEYQKILAMLEDLEDIQDVEANRKNPGEYFPLELVDRIAKGESAIRVFREYCGITQVLLAKKVGVSKQYISQLEKKERQGSASCLKKIARTLRVELDDLVC